MIEKVDVKSLNLKELEEFLLSLGEKKFRAKQDFRGLQKLLKSSVGALIEVRTKPDKGTILTVKIPKQGYVIKE